MMKADSKLKARRWLWTALRWGVALLVGWGLWGAATRAVDQFRQQQTELEAQIAALDQRVEGGQAGDDDPAASAIARERELLLRQRFHWRQIRVDWLIGSGVLYLVGLLPAAWYWRRVLQAMQQSPGIWESLRAYYVSQLGKYVPGKALVIIIRAAMIRGPQVSASSAAAAVFIESLTMIACGAALSSLIIATTLNNGWLVLFGVISAFAVGVPTIPTWFRRIVRVTGAGRTAPQLDQQLQGVTLRLVGIGWIATALLWVLFGLSMWAVTRALPGRPDTLAESLLDLPLLTACAALALVAGFVSMLPGGAGVRELVIAELLARHPSYGPVAGLTAALLLRLSWLVSELLISAILYVLPGKSLAASALSSPPDGDGQTDVAEMSIQQADISGS